MTSGAKFSTCRRYRYTLNREWGAGLRMAFVGLNPSTADETTDDPTIRRCVAFARGWGFGSLVMLNLFAWRDTSPRAMKLVDDPIGVENDAVIARIGEQSAMIVAAWGVHGSHINREQQVLCLLHDRGLAGKVRCLGTTKAGNPKHPLYLNRQTRPRAFLWRGLRFGEESGTHDHEEHDRRCDPVD